MDLVPFFLMYLVLVAAVILAHNVIPHDCDIAWHR